MQTILNGREDYIFNELNKVWVALDILQGTLAQATRCAGCVVLSVLHASGREVAA